MNADELLTLERAGWDALCSGTADEFYGRLMTPEALMVLANGQVMTRDEVVAALGGSPAWESYEIADPRVVPIGGDAAALVYVGTGRRGADSPAFVGAMTSVYVRSDGEWKLAVYQQTQVAGS
jgi:hypothetical protein